MKAKRICFLIMSGLGFAGILVVFVLTGLGIFVNPLLMGAVGIFTVICSLFAIYYQNQDYKNQD